MRLAFKILLCVIVFSACANNASEPHVSEAIVSSDEKVQNYIDSIGSSVKTKTESYKADEEASVENTSSNQQEEKALNSEDEVVIKRTASTIAQQQEAARKIQQELENRNPKPNEEEVQDGAVFQKVISSQKEKPTPNPTPVSEKAMSTAKPKTVNVNQKTTPTKTTKSTKNKTAPAIEFEEMKMTFDTIAQGDIIDYKFVFTNTGSAPLEIKAASATCGCTQPSFPFIPIEPNEQGHISVRYNSVGKEGFQNPEISVKTNIDKKEIVLFMEGFVEIEDSEEK